MADMRKVYDDLITINLYSKFQFRIIFCFEPIKMKTFDRYHLIPTFLWVLGLLKIETEM